MSSPSAFSLTKHEAMMKCPWQWRPAFLDEKRESRKRKAGDGCLYDPVDPSFVDHLVPVYAKRFCYNAFVESEEKEKIEKEIQRLRTQQTFEARCETSEDADETGDLTKKEQLSHTLSGGGSKDISEENLALVDSIMVMSKRAMEKQHTHHATLHLVSDNIEENHLVICGTLDFSMEYITDTVSY
ncbi:unnamed protein product [Albugo candida]|uniref:Uncharacterized protein n=1 Tax=Albugo candida TaxID=65357 RepID=A0A024GAE3_9STRA|nr:unnamed protein product [Albugo candida]|eukprot:CCI43826.1 unnamed protein product [Albugo candida]